MFTRTIRLFFVSLLFAAGPALAQDTYQLDIPSQPLTRALQTFAEQSGLSLVHYAKVTQDKRAPAIKGSFTPKEALGRLLKDSGLTYSYVNARTIEIRPASSPAQGADAADAPASANMQLALARNPAETAAQPQAAEKEAAQTAQADINEGKGIPEMLVKGARTSNIDIQRTEDDVQPYVVFTAEDIQRSMTGSLDQFLMKQLPMNNSPYTANTIATNAPLNGNISSVDLRGLGANQTLILVNGRRVPGVGGTSDLSQPDINGIPMSSIERVEVLPSTAGGIYGGGATGGVINIILKDDYRGFEVKARYDGTFRQDAQQRVLEANAGFSLEGGRTTIMVSGSFQDSVGLKHGDRDFAARARHQVLENNPTIYATTNIPYGNTSNIRSSNGSPLVLAAGNRPLGSNITHVPYGYAGPESDNGAALLANAGTYNMDITTGTQGLGRSITIAPSGDTLRLNLRREFTDRIEMFLDATRSRNDSVAEQGSAPHTFNNIPVGTPNNPFTTPINIKFPGNDYNYNTDVVATSEVMSVTGGVMMRLPRNWTVQAEYGWGGSEHDYTISQLSGLGIYEPPGLSGSLKLLRDVSVYPNDYSPYYGAAGLTGNQPTPTGADLRNLTLRLAGPTLTLPGGPVTLSALVERRQDETDASIFGSFSTTTMAWSYRYYPPRKQTTEGAYAELTMPLVSAANTLPLVRALDLQMSYRRDRIGSRTVLNSTQTNLPIASPDSPPPAVQYQTNHVGANQYTVGLRYQPMESLTLRVSNAVGVLPPSLAQLVPTDGANVNFGTTVLDPLRGDSPVGVVAQRRSSGNPDLKPEQSDSWSAGAIFTPAFLPGFRLSVDYTRIEKTDEIATLPSQTILDLEKIYPDRIGRLPLTDADRMANYEGGRINYFDISMTNIAHTKVEALDYRIDYRWNTPYGLFRASAIASQQTHFQKQLLTTTPVTEYMGFGDGPLEWRGNAGITWERAAWSVGWNMQYYDAFPVYFTTSSATTRAANILNQGGEFIPRQIYHDLSFQYRIDEAPMWGGIFARSLVLLGISNVFDTEPPLMLWTNVGSTVPPTTVRYGDPRLRRYSISLTKSFQ